MGTAWHNSSAYPWETTRYVSGIEVVKVNITLRIYSAKWHVYAGLAILNPAAQAQIQQYARSASELFKLMVQNKGEELGARVWAAREKVFGWKAGQEGGGSAGGAGRGPILLSEDVLDQFSLGKAGVADKERERSSNSHLSLLAMVDCWATLGIRPYEHLDVAGTPVFMLWIGEYRFHLVDRRLTSRCGRVPLPLAWTSDPRDPGRCFRPKTPAGRCRICRRGERMVRVCYIWQF
jgi:prephenate dehydrogenase (NADP+)